MIWVANQITGHHIKSNQKSNHKIFDDFKSNHLENQITFLVSNHDFQIIKSNQLVEKAGKNSILAFNFEKYIFS